MPSAILLQEGQKGRRWRRTPCRATGIRRRRSRNATISADDDQPARGPEDLRDDGRRRGGRRRFVWVFRRTSSTRSRARDRACVAGLPASLAGLRVGFMTDVHCSRWGPPEDVSRAVHRLMDERPDLIVLGGDYVTWGDRRFVKPSAEALAPLSARYGVFGILGNHDDDRYMPAALAAHGIEVLKDARTRLTIKGEILDLVGIRFWTRKAADIASADARGCGNRCASRARSATIDGGSRAERATRAVGAHARRPGRAADSRRGCGPEISRRRWNRPTTIARRCS